MMSDEFKDYYNQILKDVVNNTNNIPYSKSLVKRNYFRIKTGYYEDDNPEQIAKELAFQTNETINEVKKLISEGMLHESKQLDYIYREIVRSLTDIIKRGDTGDHYLPEELGIKDKFGNDMLEYEYPKVPSFSIEFEFQHDPTINEDYLMNADFSGEDDVIEIKLIINPEKFPQSMYDIIADLNDNVAHEMEHLFQKNMLRPDSEKDPYEDREEERPQDKRYYEQPHEIPAELKGFRRIKKLRNEPIDKVVRDWFYRNKSSILNDYDINELVVFITDEYHKRYPNN